MSSFGSFLPVPSLATTTNGDRRKSLRTQSAASSTSQRSVLQFKTVVKMLAPAIWSNLENKKKRDNPEYQVSKLSYECTLFKYKD